jgi:hypothetical protein
MTLNEGGTLFQGVGMALMIMVHALLNRYSKSALTPHA